MSSFERGRWTKSEHDLFLQGLTLYGRDWKLVSNLIPTRSSAQIRSHAQKYFAKSPSDSSSLSELCLISSDRPSSKFWSEVEKMVENPQEVERRVEETMERLSRRHEELKIKLTASPKRLIP
ncbi:hypothetical protein TrVE_jg978 [Triparma verrucosa]|uniref:Uncharacterized protein n=2 Tax=Triparma TaxID=722752 RepID=A0A9W7EW16_9STRA|nr:hypothetical protein TrST_g2639 [Triparma strigata]GMI16031.1 hypothetical protein TrVE_jg978 [Triparma verrucosa]